MRPAKKPKEERVLPPRLIAEWDNERNEPEFPDKYSTGSNVKVWWKCSKGHVWLASIANRVRGEGCPVCSGNAHYIRRFI